MLPRRDAVVSFTVWLLSLALASLLIAPATFALDAEGDAASVASDTQQTERQSEASRIFFQARDQWRDRFQLNRELEFSDQVSLAFDAKVLDLQERLFERHGRVEPISLVEWERKSVGDAGVNLSLMGDRVKVTSRYGWSISEPTPTSAAAFASAPDDWVGWRSERGPALREETGHALVQGLEGVLLQSEDMGVTAFASYRSISPAFSFASRVKAGQKGLFGEQGKQLEYGGRFRLGRMQLDLSRRSAQRWMGSEFDTLGPEHDTLRATATLTLDGLLAQPQHALVGLVSNLVPGTMWLAVAEGDVEPAEGRSVSDSTRDLAFGMSWARGAWSLDFSYWQSLYDVRQPGAEDADWQGQGFQLGYGYYASAWGLYVSGGLGRASSGGFESRYEDANLNGSLTLMFYPKRLPDLTTTLSYGDYQADYPLWSMEMATQSLSFTASLDFTKYLATDGADANQTRLQLGYRYSLTSFEETSAAGTGTGEHAVLVLVRVPF